MSDEKAIVRKAGLPEWDNLDDMIEYFVTGVNAASLTLTRIMWEAGAAALQLKDEAKYGDRAIETFSEGIKRGKTWVYECISMYETYDWDYITDKFLKAGLPPSAIARLGCISDEDARHYVETKLIEDEIKYEDIAKAKKEYQDKVAANAASLDIGEASVMENQHAAELGPEDQSVVASGKIRRECSKTADAIEKAKGPMCEIYNTFRNEFDMISDESMAEISEDRFCDVVELAISLRPIIDNLEDSGKKMRPDRFGG